MNSFWRSFRETSLAQRVGRLVGLRPGLMTGSAAADATLEEQATERVAVAEEQATERVAVAEERAT